MRPTRIEIDMAQARRNFRYIREGLNKGTLTTAVIKANAYGHGVVPFARIAKECGYESLAVAIPEEAIPIRNAGINLPIYILGLTQPSSFGLIADMDCIPAICNSTDLNALNEVGAFHNKVIHCMIAVDTGMHRIGVTPENVLSFLETIDNYKNLAVDGFFSHMACADWEDKTEAYRQLNAFIDMMNEVKANRSEDYFFSMNNSAGALSIPEGQLTAVRPGIILYGVSPFANPLEDERIRPVLSLKSVVVHLQDLEEGDHVGYSYRYTCTKPTKIATIPIGYGDGYPRLLSNTGFVLIRGVRCRIAGSVCMDQIMVEVPDGVDVQVGDEVVLIGKQGNEQIFIEELSQAAGTIVYEIFTGLTDRVPRVYYYDDVEA